MSRKDKVILYSNNVDVSSLSQIRIQAPLQITEFRIEEYNETVHQKKPQINYDYDPKFIIIQRDFPMNIDSFFYVLEEKRKQNIPYIYELDDLLFELPENHPLMENVCYSINFLPMLKAACEADLVTVSTQPIADYLRPFNSNIIVLPNYLIDEYWDFLPVKHQQTNAEKIVVGYIGGSTHREDIEMIIDPLLQINNQYPGMIEFIFWGLDPPVELKQHASVKVKPIIPEYKKYARSLVNQNFDILIAPLVDNKFNQAKSNIKFLEYSTLGAPGIFSNIRPFKEIVVDGENGLLASTPQEWFDCLKMLIDSPEMRQEIAINAQRTVQSSYMLSQHAHKWLKAYQSIDLNKKGGNTELQNQYSIQKDEILKHIFKVQQKQCQRLMNQNQQSKNINNFSEINSFITKSSQKLKTYLTRLLKN